MATGEDMFQELAELSDYVDLVRDHIRGHLDALTFLINGHHHTGPNDLAAVTAAVRDARARASCGRYAAQIK